MAIYYIGKTQRDIENINIFAGSETIFGMNENENYAMFSLTDQNKKKELSEKEQKLAFESLRYGMEKFNLFDAEATFVFSDSELMQNVMNVSVPELKVTDSQIKLVENLEEFNK
ncbi:MAG: hypothetical protein IKJ33_00790 [Clostridia bacterium]|nr:hypothetical protein [Clostridia bacterium]